MSTELDKAIEGALSGNAVLFLGAGFSKGAKDLAGNSFLDSSELSDRLITACGQTGSYDLQHASQYFIKTKGESELLKLLRELYTCSDISQAQETILNLPWSKIYTTNYDSIIAFHGSKVGRNYDQRTIDESVASVPGVTTCCYINGKLDSATPDDLNTKIKLTSTSYSSEGFVDSIWAQQFRHDIRAAKSVVFIGYSLYDLDISKILFQYENLRTKTHFITSGRIDPVRDSVLEVYGSIHAIGTEDFSRRIQRVASSYSADPEVEPEFCSFAKYLPGTLKGTISIEEVDQLILFGNVSSDALRTSLGLTEDIPEYYIRRQELEEIAELFLDEENGVENVIVHSGLANGKSMLAFGLASKLVDAGMKVFFFQDVADSLESEFEYLCRANEPTLIIIENYNTYPNVLKYICQIRSSNIKLCITIRSSVHLLEQGKLDELFEPDSYREFNIDHIDSGAASKLVKLCNQSGLWGKDASNSDWAKEQQILQECDGQFQHFLLRILHSPDIKNRVNSLLTHVLGDTQVTDMVITILILQVLNYRADFDILAELSETNHIVFNRLKRTDFSKEFLDLNRGTIHPRSALLAQYFLTECIPGDLILVTLLRCAKRCHPHWLSRPTGIDRDRIYNNLWRSLMKYGQLDLLLPHEGKRRIVNQYYESIRHLERVDREPHYWLQCSIARLAFKDYDKSERFLETAYDLAESRVDYDFTFLDNAKARLLLERMIHARNVDSFADFKEADTILSKQLADAGRMQDEKYPVRVVLNYYGDVFDQVFKVWKPEDKNEYHVRIRAMHKLASSLTKKGFDRVEQLVPVLKPILDRLDELEKARNRK